jgi:hypothetical protein
MLQSEVLEFINNYNNTDRKVIKQNLKRVMKENDFKLNDIVNLGYNRHNAAAWTNKACLNIPMLDQSLNMAVNFKFDVKQLIK